MSIIENALELLKTTEFIEMATADKEGKPNSAPKLLLKVDGKVVYLVDYSIGKTAENLKVNSRVSLSFIDSGSLFGYKLNGKAEIIKEGAIYDKCLKELQEKEIELTVERVVKAVHDGKSHKDFELEMSGRFLLYKVKIEEGSEISPRGDIKRENSR
jgi:predicted pyridoxine 5'-phosphate oxidase superfamily flavin-nucleotide-binding protein